MLKEKTNLYNLKYSNFLKIVTLSTTFTFSLSTISYVFQIFKNDYTAIIL